MLSSHRLSNALNGTLNGADDHCQTGIARPALAGA
jgi:hypothetical protein